MSIVENRQCDREGCDRTRKVEEYTFEIKKGEAVVGKTTKDLCPMHIKRAWAFVERATDAVIQRRVPEPPPAPENETTTEGAPPA